MERLPNAQSTEMTKGFEASATAYGWPPEASLFRKPLGPTTAMDAKEVLATPSVCGTNLLTLFIQWRMFNTLAAEEYSRLSPPL